MTAQAEKDPLVIAWMLATALGKGEQSLRIDLLKGLIPPADTRAPFRPRSPAARAWKLSTIRAWNPIVAERCAAIQRALADHPLTDRAA